MPACQLLLFEIPKRMSIEFYGEERERGRETEIGRTEHQKYVLDENKYVLYARDQYVRVYVYISNKFY